MLLQIPIWSAFVMLTVALIDPRTDKPFRHMACEDRTFFAIEPGMEFTVRINAHASPYDRREVVVAVDGRNVLNNEPAEPDRSTGVIISGIYDCKGFQISQQGVRTFTAAALGGGETVAERNGSAQWAGLIWVASYRSDERDPGGRPPSLGIMRGAGDSSRGVMRGMGDEFSLSMSTERSCSVGAASVGAAAGREQAAPLGSTYHWRRLGQPELVAVEYDSLSSLWNRGVKMPRLNPMWPLPQMGRFSDPSTL